VPPQAPAFSVAVRFSIADRPVRRVARVAFSERRAVRPVRVNFREVPVPNTPRVPCRVGLPDRGRRGDLEGVRGSGRVPVLAHLVQAEALVRVQVGLVPVVVRRLRARLLDRRVAQEPRAADVAASSIRRPRKVR